MSPVQPRPVREAGSLADAFERMLDRGIVIDAEFRFRIAGLAIASVEARIVVAGMETYLQYAEAMANDAPAMWLAERRAWKIGAPPCVESGRKPIHRLRLFFRDLESDLP
jgi:hypothetical protein